MEETLKIRKGTLEDLEAVWELAQGCTERMLNQDIHQWSSRYPTVEIFHRDIQNGELWVCYQDLVLAGMFVVNGHIEEGYRTCNWRYPEASYQLIHRLCVSTKMQHQGIGKRMLRLCEDMIRDAGFDSIRLEAFSENPFAVRLYEKNGYERRGEMTMDIGLFFLFEKLL